MEPPVFCIDNLSDDLAYTGHTVTANEAATEAGQMVKVEQGSRWSRRPPIRGEVRG